LLSFFLNLLLFTGATIGHAVLVIAFHNFFYGRLHSRRVIHVLQVILVLILGTGPISLGIGAGGMDLRPFLAESIEQPGGFLLVGYLILCWMVAFIVLPLVLVRRWRRRPPEILLANHTTRVDVAAQLGYRPKGIGLGSLLASLPGNQVFQVDFSERTLRLPRLPEAWDGLSILHLSDLHLCGHPDRFFYREVMDRCAAWEPDVVALTGDLVDKADQVRFLVPLLGRLRWQYAAFAILGNHDRDFQPLRLRRRLARIGMTVLNNSWAQVKIRGQPLVVIGHEGPWFQPPPDLSACPSEPFRLCLSHTPDNILWARRHRLDLMLSGHVHGGQIRFPLIGCVVIPSRFGGRYDCGTFHEPPTVLHVSRGLGGEHPLRYNCRPEVTRLILRTDPYFLGGTGRGSGPQPP
jgi:predicted MPP superfamily phosphohydrolase